MGCLGRGEDRETIDRFALVSLRSLSTPVLFEEAPPDACTCAYHSLPCHRVLMPEGRWTCVEWSFDGSGQRAKYRWVPW